jgi:hypothetical protein
MNRGSAYIPEGAITPRSVDPKAYAREYVKYRRMLEPGYHEKEIARTKRWRKETWKKNPELLKKHMEPLLRHYKSKGTK